MSLSSSHRARLLPWSGPEGKPSYVIGEGTGPVSRLADEAEVAQLRMGVELLGHARAMLGDRTVSNGEPRFLGDRLVEALRDVLRIAESRGAERAAAEHAPG
ncbi:MULTISPECIES: hypothetical protein [Streptomyces]|uniref:hypothetical protein n=1 Tax=Streptomyces TaxID=1883 RepID=UPI000B9DFB1D|nr:hypothetical protein [Streptomyces kasugaensis]